MLFSVLPSKFTTSITVPSAMACMSAPSPGAKSVPVWFVVASQPSPSHTAALVPNGEEIGTPTRKGNCTSFVSSLVKSAALYV